MKYKTQKQRTRLAIFQCRFVHLLNMTNIEITLITQPFGELDIFKVSSQMQSYGIQIHQDNSTEDGGHNCYGNVSDTTWANARVWDGDFLSDGSGRVFGWNSYILYNFLYFLSQIDRLCHFLSPAFTSLSVWNPKLKTFWWRHLCVCIFNSPL